MEPVTKFTTFLRSAAPTKSWDSGLCKPLRGRFFAMFCLCKDLVRKYPKHRFAWDRSGLQQQCDFITFPDRMIELECSVAYPGPLPNSCTKLAIFVPELG